MKKSATARLLMENWLPLTQVKTQEDVLRYKKAYRVPFTLEEFKLLLPKLDPEKIFFDTVKSHKPIYFEKETFILRQLPLEKSIFTQKVKMPSWVEGERGEDTFLKGLEIARAYREKEIWGMFLIGIVEDYRLLILDELISEATNPKTLAALQRVKNTSHTL